MHRPSLLAILLTALGCGLFSGFGIWQLGRAAEKAALFAAWEAALSAPPVALLESLGDAGLSLPQRVTGEVRFLPEPVWLLDNQQRGGRNGVLVWLAAEVEGRPERLLVNLGWLPWGRQRQLPELTLPTGQQAIAGTLSLAPRPGLRLGDHRLATAIPGPRVVTYIDLDEIAADLDAPLLTPVLLLAPELPYGFLRDWQPGLNTLPPERHQGYAFQWFALALAVLVVFLVLHRKRAKS